MAVALLDKPQTSIAVTSRGTAEFKFGQQQIDGLKKVNHWFKNDTKTQQIFRLFGYAGTGKTTLARHLAEGVDGDVVFAAYTGKASLMLQRAGCEGASTIHSGLYKARRDEGGRWEFFIDYSSAFRTAKLIVIDECSMVDEKVALDLLSFGVPILVLGDPAQLPPVGSAGYFTNVRKPDVMLTEIHRQAKDNPIIRVATDIRENRQLVPGDYGSVVIGRRGERGPADALEADQILVGRNPTRQAYNKRLRKYLGRTSDFPVEDDRLVCLRNDQQLEIFNGGLFTVEKRLPATTHNQVRMMLKSEDFPNKRPFESNVRVEFFDGDPTSIGWREMRDTQQFDYGFALTVHKAQGSQWDNVLVYDESAIFGDNANRWLYTAATRAAEQLTLIL
jgi:exodeoxyribonuclease-5